MFETEIINSFSHHLFNAINYGIIIGVIAGLLYKVFKRS